MHEPELLIVTAPAGVTEHAVLAVENVTASVDVALAETLNPASPKVLAPSAPNAIVWLALIENDRVTLSAAW